jgi:RNA polymerase sigma-70 factor, ECF subfamily
MRGNPPDSRGTIPADATGSVRFGGSANSAGGAARKRPAHASGAGDGLFPRRPDQFHPKPVRPAVEPLEAEATVDLLARVKRGDHAALERLLERCIPALRRWAHARLPQSARGMVDTADLVQDTVLAALRRLDVFEARHQGALQAYLRTAVMNRIRDVIRQRDRRPLQGDLPEDLVDDRTSPLEALIGAQRLAFYDAALQRLRSTDREAIVGRIELQYSYEELALVLDKPTANAARVAVARALKRLVDEMRHAS